MNRVQLIGRLGKEPEIKTIPSGKFVAKLSVATSERKKDDSGKWTDGPTEWHTVVVWEDKGEACSSLRKGDQVYVEGKIQTRKWDKDGDTKYFTEIVASSIYALSNLKNVENTASPSKKGKPIDDDDIPF